MSKKRIVAPHGRWLKDFAGNCSAEASSLGGAIRSRRGRVLERCVWLKKTDREADEAHLEPWIKIKNRRQELLAP